MTVRLSESAKSATPIVVTDAVHFKRLSKSLSAHVRNWLDTNGFIGKKHTLCVVPDAKGGIASVYAGVESSDDPYALAALPKALPHGEYRLDSHGLAVGSETAALSWMLGCYEFTRYKSKPKRNTTLTLPSSAEAKRGMTIAEAICLVRDLVNTPSEHMGPEELAAEAKRVAKQHGAKFSEIVGGALLKKNFPAIHAVGRAADRAPRLIEFTWGNPKHPRIALVGKGVCFDSGGLDIKGAEGMRLMKKDMGGAANVLGLASLIMTFKLPVHLHVLIPAVENAISGNAFRPGDVFKTRKGIHIEIGNTDAEGRVILCDALAYAAEHKPKLIVDMATLTGAARVALGPELPALFSNRDALAKQLVDYGMECGDPLWHMPLWNSYHSMIESPIADIVNTGGSFAGAITAALFLADFVPNDTDWCHIDLYAWNASAKPGRPVGGEAQTVRAVLTHIQRIDLSA